MEATHFVAGPWFTVEQSGSEWTHLDTITLSHGDKHETARVELRVRMEDIDDVE